MASRFLFAFLGCLLIPTIAHAQTITVPNERSLPRLDASGSSIAKRALTLTPEGVNRQDCLDDLRIRFPLQLEGFQANASMSAWASVSGVDCAQPANRSGPNALCWAIAPTIPLQQALTVDVPVRALIAGAQTEPVADDRLCGAVDFTSLDVQFLYFAPGDVAVPAVKKSLTVVVDTIGPEPPDGLHATPGAARVTVDWEAPKGVTAAMNVYCEPSPGSRLVAGTTPTTDLDAKLRCASVSGRATTAAVVAQTADGAPLESDRPLSFAVSAVDAFGNPGPLSESASATPAPGPQDEDGGGCSVTKAPRPADHGAALVAALGAVLAIRRRRMR